MQKYDRYYDVLVFPENSKCRVVVSGEDADEMFEETIRDYEELGGIKTLCYHCYRRMFYDPASDNYICPSCGNRIDRLEVFNEVETAMQEDCGYMQYSDYIYNKGIPSR